MYVRRVVSLRIIVVGLSGFVVGGGCRGSPRLRCWLEYYIVANCVCEDSIEYLVVSILGYCICRKCHLSLYYYYKYLCRVPTMQVHGILPTLYIAVY